MITKLRPKCCWCGDTFNTKYGDVKYFFNNRIRLRFCSMKCATSQYDYINKKVRK